MITKLVAPLGAAAGLVLGSLAMAGSAGASTTCASLSTGSNAGYCGQEVDVAGNAFNVQYGGAWNNNKIIAYPNSTTDTAVDFIAKVPAGGNSDQRYFQFAPGGVVKTTPSAPNGFCISDTMGGVKGGMYDGLYLRPCALKASNGWQTFTGANTYNTLATQWTNVASGKVVQDNGTRAEMTDWAPKNTTPANSNFGWDNPAPSS